MNTKITTIAQATAFARHLGRWKARANRSEEAFFNTDWESFRDRQAEFTAALAPLVAEMVKAELLTVTVFDLTHTNWVCHTPYSACINGGFQLNAQQELDPERGTSCPPENN